MGLTTVMNISQTIQLNLKVLDLWMLIHHLAFYNFSKTRSISALRSIYCYYYRLQLSSGWDQLLVIDPTDACLPTFSPEGENRSSFQNTVLCSPRDDKGQGPETSTDQLNFGDLRKKWNLDPLSNKLFNISMSSPPNTKLRPMQCEKQHTRRQSCTYKQFHK
jgi:hypothetical protein